MPSTNKRKKQVSRLKYQFHSIPRIKSKKEIKIEKEVTRLENLSASKLIEEGNKLLKKFTLFTSSKLENKLKAIERFQYAIPLLRIENKHSEAANLSLQMGEIYNGISYEYRQDKLICYWNAAMYLEISDIPREILILEELCYPLIYSYFPRYQNTYYQKMIMLHTKIGNLTKAINFALIAINYHQKLRNHTQTIQLYAKLGYLYSSQGKEDRAINCLQNAAEEVLANTTYINQDNAKDYYLDASLVALYHLSFSNAIKKITSFQEYFPLFKKGENYWLIYHIIQAFQNKSIKYFDDTLRIYQESKKKLSEWQIGALRNIKIVLNDEIGKGKIIDLST